MEFYAFALEAKPCKMSTAEDGPIRLKGEDMSMSGNEAREAARQTLMALEFLASDVMRSGPGDIGKSPDDRKIEALALAGRFAEAAKRMDPQSAALSSENVWKMNARVLWHAFSSDSVLGAKFGIKKPFGFAVKSFALEEIATELVINNSRSYGFDPVADGDAFIKEWTSTGESNPLAGGSAGWAPPPRAAISQEALDGAGAAMMSSLALMDSGRPSSFGGLGGPWWSRGAAKELASKIEFALKTPAIGAKIAARAAANLDENGLASPRQAPG